MNPENQVADDKLEKLRAYRRMKSAEFRAKNPERIKELKRSYYERNREDCLAKVKERAEIKRDQINEYHRARYRQMPERYVAAQHIRRARIFQATPGWDVELTELATVEAASLVRLRKKTTGFSWHVDHIVPLRGRKVSGLHTWNNLAVIPAKINLMKGNRHG